MNALLLGRTVSALGWLINDLTVEIRSSVRPATEPGPRLTPPPPRPHHLPSVE